MSSISGSEVAGNKDKTWLLTYFPVAWLGHACQVGHVILRPHFQNFLIVQGLAMGILGPTQPYLALMVSVPVARFFFVRK